MPQGLIDLPEIILIVSVNNQYLRPMVDELLRLDQFHLFGFVCVVIAVDRINRAKIKVTIKPLYPISEKIK